MAPEEFRALADAFDARVVQARREQDARAATLAQEFDQRRRQFYARVAPLLVGLMDRAGARAVFDENSALLTDQTLNITDEVIAAIDDAGGRGSRRRPRRIRPRRHRQPVLPVPPALEPLAPAETTPPASLLPDEVRPAPRPEGGN